jgi:hypothetical protein
VAGVVVWCCRDGAMWVMWSFGDCKHAKAKNAGISSSVVRRKVRTRERLNFATTSRQLHDPDPDPNHDHDHDHSRIYNFAPLPKVLVTIAAFVFPTFLFLLSLPLFH